MAGKRILVEVDPGREVAEIAQDFTKPIEVLRESLHNAYDAHSRHVTFIARVEKTPDARRVLTLDIFDDGEGMDEKGLESFFGLGKSLKVPRKGRRTIGQKGHGTKIYYQAREIHLITKNQGIIRYVVVRNAREAISGKVCPVPDLFIGDEAKFEAEKQGLQEPVQSGTSIRLVEFTNDSSRIIDDFQTDKLLNYLRWFTIYGSFDHIVHNQNPDIPFSLNIRGTDKHSGETAVEFGHKWPNSDMTTRAQLKKKDERRPFNWFVKTFRYPNYAIEDGYHIDVLMLFEGRSARLERDKPGIIRQKVGGFYSEDERYGVWLCKDYIPIEFRPDLLTEEGFPFQLVTLRRPLIFVNSQDFKLIANRGSVGNSERQLLVAVQNAIKKLLDEVQEDKDLKVFLDEYQEDLFSRIREKDNKALQKRIARYNQKERVSIVLSNGSTHEFWEPQREITLFGILAELNVLDPTVLGFEILDYDDRFGIDMLVKRNGSTGALLDKKKVAYVELKFDLQTQLNHAFDYLYAIVCWTTQLAPENRVFDATHQEAIYQEHTDKDGIVTHSQLVPLPNSSLSHNIRVVVLSRLLKEKYSMTTSSNPRQIKK